MGNIGDPCGNSRAMSLVKCLCLYGLVERGLTLTNRPFTLMKAPGATRNARKCFEKTYRFVCLDSISALCCPPRCCRNDGDIFPGWECSLSLMSRSPTVFHHCWSLDTGLLAVRVPTHRNGIPCQTVLVHLQNVSDRKQHFREP